MNKSTKPLLPLLIAACLLIGAVLAGISPAGAQTETYQTPTPNAQGRIIYDVQEGDTCTAISFKTGISITDIISLNGLTADCSINPGNQLLLGSVDPSLFTATPPPTATRVVGTPTATPLPGFATICVVLFHDMDGNGMRTEGESYLYGGEVSVNNRLGTVSLTGTTVAGNPDELDPRCFEDIPQGSYNVSVAIPDGFNATTVTNYALEVKAGEEATIDFGAQESRPASEVIAADNARRIPWVGIIGLILLLAGVGLGYYMIRTHKA